MFKSLFRHDVLICTVCIFFIFEAFAEEKKIGVSFDARVVDTIQLISPEQDITLWGVEKIHENAMLLNVKARSALADKIGEKPILCDIENVEGRQILAQCTNSFHEDLSLFLLQHGYVNSDRKVLSGTVYEQPYLKAEKEARQNKRGIWSDYLYHQAPPTSSWSSDSINTLMALGVTLALVLCALGLMIMRGFKNAVEVQNKSIDIAEQERSLKEREKNILVSMLLAEVKSNRAKIEAHIIIYQDVLKDVVDTGSVPYQAGGDVVQKQPELNRIVFDNHASKLEMMGAQLASDLIHYYARIKTVPDYVEIKPDHNKKDVQDLVETSIENAQKLDALSASLIQKMSAQEAMKVE